jgi:hypothetical protein
MRVAERCEDNECAGRALLIMLEELSGRVEPVREHRGCEKNEKTACNNSTNQCTHACCKVHRSRDCEQRSRVLLGFTISKSYQLILNFINSPTNQAYFRVEYPG